MTKVKELKEFLEKIRTKNNFSESFQKKEGLSENLKNEALHNDHKRNEKKKSFLWWISIIITGLVVLGIIFMGIIWFIHLVMPAWRWMEPVDLAELKSILFSSIISAILAPFIHKNLSN